MSKIIDLKKVPIETWTQYGNKSNQKWFIQRNDLIHPEVSGNKWWKLKWVIDKVKGENLAGIVTFGGAYSNHLLAVAAWCHIEDISCTLFVRGDELNSESNAHLKYCEKLGAHLKFLSRGDFNLNKRKEGVFIERGLSFLYVPEGGASALGVKGASEMISSNMVYDVYALALGTGTTALGILLNSPINSEVWVFPVLKGFDVFKEMEHLAKNSGIQKDWEIHKSRLRVFSHYHFGGYGKKTKELESFVSQINTTQRFQVEPVYTGKALFGMIEELKNSDCENVLFIHTGGILNL